jgi:hypothetical protein
MKNVPVAAAVESTNSLQRVKRKQSHREDNQQTLPNRDNQNNNQQPIETTDDREVEKVDYEKDDVVKKINTKCTTTYTTQ